jgi:hypothetical protein
VSEPCKLCGREKLTDRVQRPPPMLPHEHEETCLHPAHIYDQPLPPCEALGVKRIAVLEARLASAERVVRAARESALDPTSETLACAKLAILDHLNAYPDAAKDL